MITAATKADALHAQRLATDRHYATCHGFTLIAQVPRRDGKPGLRWAFAAPLASLSSPEEAPSRSYTAPGQYLTLLCPQTHDLYIDRVRRSLIAQRWPTRSRAAERDPIMAYPA